MSLIQQLESRLPRSASDNSRHALRSALMIAEGHAKKAAEIRADARLSDQGKADELAKHKAATLKNGHLIQIRDLAKKQLEGLRGERDSFRSAVLKPPVDALAEARHAEIRTMLRTLPEPERIKLAMENDAVRDAVAVAPAVLSGIPSVIHGQIIDGLVETRFASRAKDLEAQQEEAETVAAAAQVATDMIARN
jgi:hypothetical protein